MTIPFGLLNWTCPHDVPQEHGLWHILSFAGRSE